MTALAGFWSLGDLTDAGESCERMLKAQQIYAADDGVCWSESGLALGRRLFRLLPEDRFDRGPIVSADGRCVLVADVRLDNREELCRGLDITIGEAGPLSDSAILMKALHRWDEGAVDWLSGDFAFALWDGPRERLLLARDFMGQRPLHYHRGDGFFAFASMPKGLHALPQIPRGPDPQATADFLALMGEPSSGSFFQGIERVMPGHLVMVTKGSVSSRKYWHPPTRQIRLGNAEEYAEALREQMDRAVGARLRGTGGRVAAHLSGGFDSSTVAATAARLLAREGGSVTAFTSVPREGYSDPHVRDRIADEGDLAANVAELYPNMEHIRISAGGNSPLATLDRSFFLYERPFLNICNCVWVDAIMDAAKEKRFSVMLSGIMGNVSFSYGGMELLPELLARGRLLRLSREGYSLLRSGTGLGALASRTLGPLLPEIIWRRLRRLRGSESALSDYTVINADRVGHLDKKAADRRFNAMWRYRSNAMAARVSMIGHLDYGNYNKGWLGGWGIDLRDPTADRRLMEFCLAIPTDQYLVRGTPRALARRAFEDRLPQSVLRERRIGHQAADWHEGLSASLGQLRDEVARLAEVPAAAEALDTDRMVQLVENWPEGGWNDGAVAKQYRYALLRGVSAGHFIRKAMASNQ